MNEEVQNIPNKREFYRKIIHTQNFRKTKYFSSTNLNQTITIKKLDHQDLAFS